jgi:hypothetical protein
MLSIPFIDKISGPNLKNNFVFLVPMSTTHTDLDCVKKLSDDYLMIESFKVLNVLSVSKV